MKKHIILMGIILIVGSVSARSEEAMIANEAWRIAYDRQDQDKLEKYISAMKLSADQKKIIVEHIARDKYVSLKEVKHRFASWLVVLPISFIWLVINARCCGHNPRPFLVGESIITGGVVGGHWVYNSYYRWKAHQIIRNVLEEKPDDATNV